MFMILSNMKKSNGELIPKRLEKFRPKRPCYRKPKNEICDMTICIAAIHNDGGIVGVADKMISTDVMAFEPKGTSKKIFALAPGIFALNAGHVAIQAEIMESMQASFNREKAKGRPERYTVKELVDGYVDCYNEVKRHRIRSEIFAPWNLSEESFLDRQKEFSDVFVRDLMDQVDRFVLPDIATIITGVDISTGQVEPHIYCIKCSYGKISIECCDSVGYAAIGSGAYHVESYFMFSKFTRHFSMPTALALCYFAKRRSEIAPNVGKETDMFLLGPPIGHSVNLEKILDYKMLAEMNDYIVSNEQSVTEGAFEKIAEGLKGNLAVYPIVIN